MMPHEIGLAQPENPINTRNGGYYVSLL